MWIHSHYNNILLVLAKNKLFFNMPKFWKNCLGCKKLIFDCIEEKLLNRGSFDH
jgi:hypothetical protein